MKIKEYSNSQIINGVAMGFSVALLLSALIAAKYTGEWGSLLKHWYLIMITPCPLVTDYLAIGGLGSAMLNAGACGLVCALFMIGLKGESRANTLAGYFLVVAHCFYGLNFLNMWPCFLAPFIYLHHMKLNYKSNLQVCMFATSFAPFISEFLFRYTIPEEFVFGEVHLTGAGVLLAVLFSVMLGYVIPAILPGANAWHKGYSLFNGGLAFGIFGFFVFNFMYRTQGLRAPEVISPPNAVYEQFGFSYRLYGNCFYITIFLICILVGFILNHFSFGNIRQLLKDTGYRSNFAENYGMPTCLINIGVYGIFFLAYFNLVIHFTEGSGFTGPTFGVILAALTFACMGQHPRNVWPILAGYMLLYLCTMFLCQINGRPLTWTISTQGYLNAAAFATGMSPLVGRYGIRAGMVAGFLCASMCTATSALHGGLVLYNGGFTSGLTVLILLPILEHYFPEGAREHIKENSAIVQDMISLVGNYTPPKLSDLSIPPDLDKWD